MKVRVKYQVTEAGRFLGHLDLTRTIMKTLRRANLPVMLTEGFNPHPRLSFAMPLSVGHTALGEYFEITLTEKIPEQEIIERFNQCSPQAIVAAEARAITEKQDSMSSQITCAVYQITLPLSEKEKVRQAISDILSAETIMIEKKTKRKIKETDIRPLIYDLQIVDQPQEESGILLQALISHGSTDNLKISDLLALFGQRFSDIQVQDGLITREGLYVKEEDQIRSLIDF